MADNPHINWTLANSYGIWMNQNPQHGMLNRLRASTNGIPVVQPMFYVAPTANLGVASANGGIWLVSDRNKAGMVNRMKEHSRAVNGKLQVMTGICSKFSRYARKGFHLMTKSSS